MKSLLFLEAIKPGEIIIVLIFGVVFIIGLITIIRRLRKGKYNDIITLKNGSVINGKIIEQMPNVSVKVEMQDKNIIVYKNEEIEKITKK